MQSHAVADAPLEGSPDEPECDDAERYDTSSDNIELPTDQKVGDSSSSERASKSPSQRYFFSDHQRAKAGSAWALANVLQTDARAVPRDRHP